MLLEGLMKRRHTHTHIQRDREPEEGERKDASRVYMQEMSGNVYLKLLKFILMSQTLVVILGRQEYVGCYHIFSALSKTFNLNQDI